MKNITPCLQSSVLGTLCRKHGTSINFVVVVIQKSLKFNGMEIYTS